MKTDQLHTKIIRHLESEGISDARIENGHIICGEKSFPLTGVITRKKLDAIASEIQHPTDKDHA